MAQRKMTNNDILYNTTQKTIDRVLFNRSVHLILNKYLFVKN